MKMASGGATINPSLFIAPDLPYKKQKANDGIARGGMGNHDGNLNYQG